jgi:hypothetical protein
VNVKTLTSTNLFPESGWDPWPPLQINFIEVANKPQRTSIVEFWHILIRFIRSVHIQHSRYMLFVFWISFRQVNLLYVFRTPNGGRGGRKIYTGSDITSLHLVIDSLHYRHHWWSKLIVLQVRREREERLPSLLSWRRGSGLEVLLLFIRLLRVVSFFR